MILRPGRDHGGESRRHSQELIPITTLATRPVAPCPVTEQRPWGGFEQFTLNEQSSVKVITVAPYARLSLQTHVHRSEFWQVLDGPMEITVDERTWIAVSGERVWVPAGSAHRIANPTEDVARILEVAFGHFDEDDIHRLQDDYAR